jgi:methionyl-tRNA formyltransferase
VILNGEKESGMTIMHIVKALDAGPMISKKAFPLSLTETHESLSQKLIDDGIEMLTPFITGTPVPEGEEQDHSAATHCGKLHKADTKLNPGKTDAFACDRIIRAFSPSPGAILRINTPKGEKQFKIIEAIPRNDGPDAGHFLIDNQQISLGCQDNTHLDLKIVQMEGKPAMATADFLRGFRGELELSQN